MVCQTRKIHQEEWNELCAEPGRCVESRVDLLLLFIIIMKTYIALNHDML